MCFTFCCARSDEFAAVSTCTGRTLTLAGGGVVHDEVEKLAQLTGGWFTGTGDVAMFTRGAAALRAVDAADLGAVQSALGGAWRRAGHDEHEGLDRLVFVRWDGRTFQAHQLHPDGRLGRTAAPSEQLLSYGGELDAGERVAVEQALAGQLSAARSLADLVLAVAAAQARLRKLTPAVGAGIRVGLMLRGAARPEFYHLAAPVADLLEGGTREVERRLRPVGERVWPQITTQTWRYN